MRREYKLERTGMKDEDKKEKVSILISRGFSSNLYRFYKSRTCENWGLLCRPFRTVV
jgi:hypothetical protein